jgi:hypothetical protein
MTALGKTRRFDPQPVTFGLPQSTDIARRAQLVRFVPMSDIAVSFEYFAGASALRRRTITPSIAAA